MIKIDKQKLLEKGCCNFTITDSNLLSELKSLSLKQEFQPKNWKKLRWSHWGMEFLSTEEALDFVDHYQYIGEPTQCYFQMPINSNEDSITKAVSNVIKSWTSEAYDIDESEIHPPALCLNIMPKGFHIRNHRDGGDGGKTRLVAFLIYMNEDWTDTDGGELVIHGGMETISPKFGRVVMIDLTKHDIEHEVKLITGDKSRKVLVSFVNKS
jgi:Rps23 Pro-64 3,4-dihydroxylase Tpa1-like proline 4-hydroxylase|tara:strand:- start:16682 stop:17314 length:633 start_codon:yes stop_codon:yes gene_type:complete